jgi:tetratricopeptide (TPR) repeat protein/transglutaminase-like putative cysteine protease
MVRTFFLLLLFQCPTLLGQPQSGPPAKSAPGPALVSRGAETSKPDLKQEAFVIEETFTTATYEADGTGSRETISRVRVQSDAGVQQFGLLVFGYQKAFENLDVAYVRVRKPDGRIVNTPLEDIPDLDSEITRSAPLYSDLREKHVAVKGLAVGDVVEWKSTVHQFKALAPNHFWLNYEFTKRAIILDEQLKLSVPGNSYINVRSPEFKPIVREEAGRKIYEWKHAQLVRPQETKERFGPPFLRRQPDVQISSFRSWDEVGRWYDSLQRERVVPSSDVRAKALELTKDARSDDEKIRALYDFVATKFRYVGVDFGIGRYQPHSADDVLGNSYGDCKDKHTLLASLLQAVGIEAWPALISSAHAIDADLPSPAQFDHVITAVRHGKDLNDLLWLDTTSEVAPFAQLMINLRDKPALVIPANALARLIKTPGQPAIGGSEQFRLTGTLSDSGELQASIEDLSRGDSEIALRAAFRSVPKPQWNELVQRISYALGYAGTVTDVSSSIPEKTSEPFRFSYKYDRKEIGDWDNKRMTAALPPMGLPVLNDEYQKSGEPVRLDAPNEVNYTADIQSPPSYVPTLPENVDLSSDFAEYHSKYSLKDGVLHTERRLVVKKNEVPAQSYSAYRDFTQKISDDESSWIVFTDKTAARPPSPSGGAPADGAGAMPFPAPPDTPAGRLYLSGLTLVRDGDAHAALEKLQQASKLDPKLPGIWSLIGLSHMALHENDKGIEAMRQQIKETPDLLPPYKMLGATLMSLHRMEEAVPVWRDLMKRDPKDEDAPANLGSCLLALKQYKQAIDELEESVKVNNNARTYFQLGNAYLNLQSGDKAYEAYSKAVDLDETYSGTRNDAAYSLAEKNLHLSEAMLWAKEAVTDKEDETRAIDLDHLDLKDLQTMNLLSAYWDTLGWVHFRKAEYDAAERYLQASWWLRQDTAIGDHLGQVYEKMHNPRKAVRFYSLAIAAPDNAEKGPSQERLAHVSGTRSQNEMNHAGAELGQIRTFHLPRITTKQTSAEFFLLLTNNGEGRLPAMERAAQASNPMVQRTVTADSSANPAKIEGPPHATVEQVKFISGSEELRKAEDLLKKFDFGAQFPDMSLTKVVRRGILMCGPIRSSCDFVLMTADSVRSVN